MCGDLELSLLLTLTPQRHHCHHQLPSPSLLIPLPSLCHSTILFAVAIHCVFVSRLLQTEFPVLVLPLTLDLRRLICQVVTLNTVPNPPVNPMIALPSTASTITIKWDKPADTGGQPIISYKVWLWSSDTNTWDGGTR